MNILNSVSTVTPTVPQYLSNKFEMISTCKLTEELALVFSLSLRAIVDELFDDNIKPEDVTRVTVVFTNNGSFSMEERNQATCRLHFSLVVLLIDNLMKMGV